MHGPTESGSEKLISLHTKPSCCYRSRDQGDYCHNVTVYTLTPAVSTNPSDERHNIGTLLLVVNTRFLNSCGANTPLLHVAALVVIVIGVANTTNLRLDNAFSVTLPVFSCNSTHPAVLLGLLYGSAL